MPAASAAMALEAEAEAAATLTPMQLVALEVAKVAA